jgi:feruloyl-CoA synthase
VNISEASSITLAGHVPVNFLPARVAVERRTDGTIVLRSPEPLAPYARCMGEYLELWAVQKPDSLFLAERRADSSWRTLTWADARSRVRAIAAALLKRDLSAERPVAILSSNSIDHAVLALAAMHVGIPVAPISPAYSLLSKDFAKLRSALALLQPGLVFVEDGEAFAAALAAVTDFDFELITARNHERLPCGGGPLATLEGEEDDPEVERAFLSVGPDTIAKFLLTSGSTGQPKAVINTQRMLCSNQQSLAQAWPFLREEPPVLVDWLPWNHTFGGNNNVGLVLTHGGTLYIDEGKPAPGLIEITVHNLREVSPTIYYNAPRGYDALLPYLESDLALRQSFFARLRVMCYSGAGMPLNLWKRLEQLSVAELGCRVAMSSGWGSTETAPQVTLVHFDPIGPNVLGLPTPGCELKMVPVDATGKHELRVRGPNVMPGYWKQNALTTAAFDEEGFYRIGDAGRFADPSDPSKGIEFAGRIAEDFKLASGTWVHVGPLRVRAISAFSPVAQDVVVVGPDRNELGFLVFPNLAGCLSLCSDLDNTAEPDEVLAHPAVRERVRAGMAALKVEGGGSSMYPARVVLLAEQPSSDAGEITDKGYVNQRAVIARRGELVERLYSQPPGPEVIQLNAPSEPKLETTTERRRPL